MSDGYMPTPGTETWEAATDGTVWVFVSDPRTPGGYKKQRVGGKQGSKLLRISIDDRRYNEELVVVENIDGNVFRNGMLRLVKTHGAPENYESDVDTTYHMTAEQLREFFDVKDIDAFKEAMEDIPSELVLRRLKDESEKHGTMEQLHVLQDLVEKRYSNHKSQKVVQQMEADGDDGSVRLS